LIDAACRAASAVGAPEREPSAFMDMILAVQISLMETQRRLGDDGDSGAFRLAHRGGLDRAAAPTPGAVTYAENQSPGADRRSGFMRFAICAWVTSSVCVTTFHLWPHGSSICPAKN
jgi:hypothetical protein